MRYFLLLSQFFLIASCTSFNRKIYRNISNTGASEKEFVNRSLMFNSLVTNKFIDQKRPYLDVAREELQKLADSGQHDLRLRLISSTTFGAIYVQELIQEDTSYHEIHEALTNKYAFSDYSNSALSMGDMLITSEEHVMDQKYIDRLIYYGYDISKAGPAVTDYWREHYKNHGEKISPNIIKFLQASNNDYSSETDVISLSDLSPDEQKTVNDTKDFIAKNQGFACYEEISFPEDRFHIVNLCKELENMFLWVNNYKINKRRSPSFLTRIFKGKTCFVQNVLRFDRDEKLISVKGFSHNIKDIENSSYFLARRTRSSSDNAEAKEFYPFLKAYDFAKNVCPGFIIIEKKYLEKSIERKNTNNQSSEEQSAYLLEIKNINLDRYECLFKGKPLSCYLD